MTGHCDCTAGLCESCSHVAAVLRREQLQFLNMLDDRSPYAEVLNSFNAFATTSKKPWCFSQHEVTEEEVDKVERATIRLASCVQWHQERVGRIAGSRQTVS
ncbi:unnamed protein product [Leuciscus chuanchicus]